MAFRTLTIDSAAELHVRSGQLTIQREADPNPLFVDLDDLACIVLANLDITLSTGALNVISEHGITILGVGRNYMPTNIVLPFAKNSRYSGIVDAQLGMSVPFRKQLWKRIVAQKILNQAEALRIIGKDDYAELVKMANQVRSGDPDNREAIAARFYFPRLSDGLIRGEVSPRNSLLNYGYAIVRSVLARAVVSHGFITSVGLHHDNGRNEFNLVDDLIEPFRPMVDLQMLQVDADAEDPDRLTRPARRQMTAVLRNACHIAGRETSCLVATEEMVVSLMRAIETKDARKLQLPSLLEPRQVD